MNNLNELNETVRQGAMVYRIEHSTLVAEVKGESRSWPSGSGFVRL